MALGQGGLGLRGGGPGRGQPVGPRPGPGAVRPAGHLPDLVAGLPGGDQAGHGVRAGNPAREGARVRRAAGGDAAGDRGRARAAVLLRLRPDHHRRVSAPAVSRLLPLGDEITRAWLPGPMMLNEAARRGRAVTPGPVGTGGPAGSGPPWAA